MDYDETDLTKRVQDGDLAAFEKLLDNHSSHLRAFIAMKLPIPHLIDEIAHETFIFAHRNIFDFEPGTDFGKWLRAIAFNMIRKETLRQKRLRQNQEKFLHNQILQHAASAAVTPEAPVMVYLEECLRLLPERQQRLLHHKYRLSESSREIASSFQQSEAWVRTTLCRIRTSLRKCVEDRSLADTPTLSTT